ncbi:flagellar hook-length control protein FliK [Pseudomonas typographi]|uniref:flagellar hook-length control protein FliK n=1 Tax=Pseudomonas typographi TaxID=2715964 RepID=UPI0016858C0A|nr:flagellar hook-length control protein FliK [Pseudomonas typographi]MBD1586697.1 flagellar hook-length control protein FliK [Pseudomonas typographi]
MPSEINPVAASAALATAQRNAANVGEVLKLLQPIGESLQPGQTATAEVLAVKQVLAQNVQSFQLLLALTLGNGKTLTVQVGAGQPLAQGTQLLVQKLFSEQLMVTSPTGDNRGSLTALDTRQLPIGTLLQGKVLTSIPLPPQTPGGAVTYRSTVVLLNTALAGQSLAIDSPQPLRLGSLLSAQVQGSQALRWVQVGNRLDQLAVQQQLSTQQSRQASLPGLLALLQNVQGKPNLPAGVAQSAQALLASLPNVAQMVTPQAVAQALQNSGVFLESSLLTGLHRPELAAPDLKTALLRLVAQVLPNLPAGQDINPATLATWVQAMARNPQSNRLRNALGQAGAAAPAGAINADFPLPLRNVDARDDEDALQTLLRLASAVLSRVQSHQLSSLEHSGIQPDGKLLSTWQMEIPLRHFSDIVPLQVRLQSEERPDEAPRRDNEGRELPKRKLWRLELAFDLAPLGPLQVQAQLVGEQLSSQLWAENSATAALVQSQLGYLRERLGGAGLTVGDLDCHLGLPARGPRTQLEQRWVDETA